jgi:hypothetical protein
MQSSKPLERVRFEAGEQVPNDLLASKTLLGKERLAEGELVPGIHRWVMEDGGERTVAVNINPKRLVPRSWLPLSSKTEMGASQSGMQRAGRRRDRWFVFMLALFCCLEMMWLSSKRMALHQS